MLLHNLDASGVLAGLREGKFSVGEYVGELLLRAGRYSDLNAFSSLDEDDIRANADAADAALRRADTIGALHGLAIAIKDNINVAGQPTTAGTPALRNNRTKADAPVVDALRRAGAIPFGRTNMHELAYGLTSNNAAFGAVRNPYDRDLIAGGSSGGSAVAVAARLVPAALGTDTGGSVRVPAALCGLVGLRPTIGRYSAAGIVPISHTRDTAGPITRSVADAVLLDGVLGGQDEAPPTVSLGGLRIGVPRGYFFDPLDDELSHVIENELDWLAGEGVVLIEADMDEVAGCNPRIGRPITSAEILDDLPRYLAAHGGGIGLGDVLAQVASPDVRAVVERQFDPKERDGIMAAYELAMRRDRPALRAAYERYFEDHRLDAILIPTAPVPARPIGDDETVELAGRRHSTTGTFVRNTGPTSIIGLPGLAIPVGLTASGLPVGMELDGRAGHDRRLLAIGLAWEKLHPPMPPPPGILS